MNRLKRKRLIENAVKHVLIGEKAVTQKQADKENRQATIDEELKKLMSIANNDKIVSGLNKLLNDKDFGEYDTTDKGADYQDEVLSLISNLKEYLEEIRDIKINKANLKNIKSRTGNALSNVGRLQQRFEDIQDAPLQIFSSSADVTKIANSLTPVVPIVDDIQSALFSFDEAISSYSDAERRRRPKRKLKAKDIGWAKYRNAGKDHHSKDIRVKMQLQWERLNKAGKLNAEGSFKGWVEWYNKFRKTGDTGVKDRPNMKKLNNKSFGRRTHFKPETILNVLKDLNKSKSTVTIEENLSRGALYRKRYYGRY